jgi:hypothetical protein
MLKVVMKKIVLVFNCFKQELEDEWRISFLVETRFSRHRAREYINLTGTGTCLQDILYLVCAA